MSRLFLAALALCASSLFAQPADAGPGLVGRVEGKNYVSPTGVFKIAVPVLPELGGSITDTDNVVTFQDEFNVHISIAAFPQDATQRWELSTRGLKDYLIFFFSNYVMADFQQMFPGARVESAKFAASMLDGSLIAFTLLPGGSMFGEKIASIAGDSKLPIAKRGNLVFVKNGHILVVSTELAERVLERSAYTKTTAEEDELLRARLTEIAAKLEFVRPAVDKK